MAEQKPALPPDVSDLPDARLTAEGAANRLVGWAAAVVTTIAVAMSLFHLYAAYEIVPTQPLRYAHVAFVMVLCFLVFPFGKSFRNRIRWWDVIAAAASV